MHSKRNTEWVKETGKLKARVTVLLKDLETEAEAVECIKEAEVKANNTK
jgi:hypothetical protein